MDRWSARLQVVQEGPCLGEGGVDLQSRADGLDGGFLLFLCDAGAGEVVEDALVVGGDGEGLLQFLDDLLAGALPADLDAFIKELRHDGFCHAAEYLKNAQPEAFTRQADRGFAFTSTAFLEREM